MNKYTLHCARFFVWARYAPRHFILGHLLLTCCLWGCGDEGVQEQQIAKGIEKIPAADAPEIPESPDTPDTSPSPFPWVTPETWMLDETPRQMRVATYIASAAGGEHEIAVTRFPGRVGGELANINRWRGQMGLAPIGKPELERNLERFVTAGFDGYQARIESDRGVMLAAGVFDESINQTWFVRATLTNTATADELEDEVFEMARSITRLSEGP